MTKNTNTNTNKATTNTNKATTNTATYERTKAEAKRLLVLASEIINAKGYDADAVHAYSRIMVQRQTLKAYANGWTDRPYDYYDACTLPECFADYFETAHVNKVKDIADGEHIRADASGCYISLEVSGIGTDSNDAYTNNNAVELESVCTLEIYECLADGVDDALTMCKRTSNAIQRTMRHTNNAKIDNDRYTVNEYRIVDELASNHKPNYNRHKFDALKLLDGANYLNPSEIALLKDVVIERHSVRQYAELTKTADSPKNYQSAMQKRFVRASDKLIEHGAFANEPYYCNLTTDDARDGRTRATAKPVNATNEDTQEVVCFESIRKASSALGCSYTAIQHALKDGQAVNITDADTSATYRWTFRKA